MDTRLKPHHKPLPGIGRKDIDKILQLASDLLSVVYQNYVDSELNFPPHSIGGAADLIRRLQMGKEHQDTQDRIWEELVAQQATFAAHSAADS